MSVFCTAVTVRDKSSVGAQNNSGNEVIIAATSPAITNTSSKASSTLDFGIIHYSYPVILITG
jgi:hypothetical protein